MFLNLRDIHTLHVFLKLLLNHIDQIITLAEFVLLHCTHDQLLDPEGNRLHLPLLPPDQSLHLHLLHNLRLQRPQVEL